MSLNIKFCGKAQTSACWHFGIVTCHEHLDTAKRNKLQTCGIVSKALHVARQICPVICIHYNVSCVARMFVVVCCCIHPIVHVVVRLNEDSCGMGSHHVKLKPDVVWNKNVPR